MRILISACLLGIYCRYDGGEKRNDSLISLLNGHELIPFCPEIYGGLPTPREPAEILNGRVVTKSGRDVTAEYLRGAQQTVRIAKMLSCDCAVLQDRSPTCGCGVIHNGLFDGGLIPGSGIAAQALLDADIPVFSASSVIDAGGIPKP